MFSGASPTARAELEAINARLAVERPALAPAVLICVALLGCLFPLRRAVRVNPVVALRHG
jgi:ABC-type lipoprotein release transport system permease subunit